MTMNKAVERGIKEKLDRIRKIASELRFNLGLMGAKKPCQEIEKLVHSIDAELAKLCSDDWGGGGSHPDWDSGTKKDW